MPLSISESELNTRIEKLKSGQRPAIGELEEHIYVYFRLPREVFCDGCLIEGGFSMNKFVRNPEQSVTLGICDHDCIDALIKQDSKNGDFLEFLGDKYGIVRLKKAVIIQSNHTYQRSNPDELTTYCMAVTHTPYKWNYAHGDVKSLVNCTPGKWSNKSARESIKDELISKIIDHDGIAYSPG
jgi:hypothetical protein